MTIWIALVVIAAGITGVVLLVHLTGGSEPAHLVKRAEVIAMWNSQFPETPAKNAVLEPAGLAALIDLENGGTGLLWAFGNHVVGRVLNTGSLRTDKDHLYLTLPDFTAPRLSIEINEPTVRLIWAETIKAALAKGATA